MTVLESILKRIADEDNPCKDEYSIQAYDKAMRKAIDILQEYLDKEKQQITDAYNSGSAAPKSTDEFVFASGNAAEDYYTNLKAK